MCGELEEDTHYPGLKGTDGAAARKLMEVGVYDPVFYGEGKRTLCWFHGHPAEPDML
jgi:hypothetical protein